MLGRGAYRKAWQEASNWSANMKAGGEENDRQESKKDKDEMEI